LYDRRRTGAEALNFSNCYDLAYTEVRAYGIGNCSRLHLASLPQSSLKGSKKEEKHKSKSNNNIWNLSSTFGGGPKQSMAERQMEALERCVHSAAVRSVASIVETVPIDDKVNNETSRGEDGGNEMRRKWSTKEASVCVDSMWKRALADVKPFKIDP
jgi:hypothetical protein